MNSTVFWTLWLMAWSRAHPSVSVEKSDSGSSRGHTQVPEWAVASGQAWHTPVVSLHVSAVQCLQPLPDLRCGGSEEPSGQWRRLPAELILPVLSGW